MQLYVWGLYKKFPTGAWGKSFAKVRNFDLQKTHALSTLRNICAHYGRLYNRRLKITPKLFKADRKKGIRNDTVFANIHIIGRLSQGTREWQHFVTKLAALIEEYEVVKLRYLGFPKNWEDILRDLG